MVILNFFWGICLDILAKPCNFWLTFWTIFKRWFSNINLWSIRIPNTSSYLLPLSWFSPTLIYIYIIRCCQNTWFSTNCFKVVVLKPCKNWRGVFFKLTQNKVHIWFTSIKSNVVRVTNDISNCIEKDRTYWSYIILHLLIASILHPSYFSVRLHSVCRGSLITTYIKLPQSHSGDN